MIPPSEFARRLCAVAHPMFATTGNPVPCGTHIAQSQRLWGLVGDEGTRALAVILEVRAENGAEPLAAAPVTRVAIREPETSDDDAGGAEDYSGTPV